MGIARGAIALLAQEAARRPFTGKLATLGRQRIHASSEEATRQMQRFGIVPRRTLTDPVDDVSLFEALGFDTVHSYDYSDYEAATYLLDLNSGVVPDGATGAYDVVFDSGTIEHVFHVPNSLKTIVEMTKVGGRIILLSPSSNHLDHGFYMFSPTLFCDYFATNKLEVETSYLVRYSPDPGAAWKVYRYHPREWDTLQIGGLGPTSISWSRRRRSTRPAGSFRSRTSTPRRRPNTADLASQTMPPRRLQMSLTPRAREARECGRRRARPSGVCPVHWHSHRKSCARLARRS